METEGLSFPEAVERLAAEAGVPMPERDPEAEAREEERATPLRRARARGEILRGERCSRAPAPPRAATSRTAASAPDLQRRFRIGYAPPDRNALKEHLAAKDVTQEQMIAAGLLISGDDVPVSFDRFRDRVIFPITDFRGRIVGFGGRALAADVPAKYLNSPETELFHKGSLLYNGAEARKAAHDAGTVIAVEGYVDVIQMVGAGFAHTVAPLGTALTERQLQILWRMADEPILCFDGDSAGIRAAHRAADLALPLLEPGKSLRFALLPEGQDPDDLIRGEGRRRWPTCSPPPGRWSTSSGRARPRPASSTRPSAAPRSRRASARSPAAIGDESVRRHYAQAFTERVAAFFPAPERSANSEWRRANRKKGRRAPGLRPVYARALFADTLGLPARSPSPTASSAPPSSGRAAGMPLREVVLVDDAPQPSRADPPPSRRVRPSRARRSRPRRARSRRCSKSSPARRDGEAANSGKRSAPADLPR